MKVIALKIMDCDTVIGESKEQIINWYSKNICNLSEESDEIVDIVEESSMIGDGMWYPTDKDIKEPVKQDPTKTSFGDFNYWEGEMCEFMSLQDAFDIETKEGKEFKEPFVLARSEV